MAYLGKFKGQWIFLGFYDIVQSVSNIKEEFNCLHT